MCFSATSLVLRWSQPPKPLFPPSVTRPQLCSSASALRTWPAPWQSSALPHRRYHTSCFSFVWYSSFRIRHHDSASLALVLNKLTHSNFLCVYMQAQEACGPLEIDNALAMVRKLEKDMQEAKASAMEGKLKPLPGETVRHTQEQPLFFFSQQYALFIRSHIVLRKVEINCFFHFLVSFCGQLEKCSQDLGTSTKAVSSAIAQLLSEATQGDENYTGGFNVNATRHSF